MRPCRLCSATSCSPPAREARRLLEHLPPTARGTALPPALEPQTLAARFPSLPCRRRKARDSGAPIAACQVCKSAASAQGDGPPRSTWVQASCRCAPLCKAARVSFRGAGVGGPRCCLQGADPGAPRGRCCLHGCQGRFVQVPQRRPYGRPRPSAHAGQRRGGQRRGGQPAHGSRGRPGAPATTAAPRRGAVPTGWRRGSGRGHGVRQWVLPRLLARHGARPWPRGPARQRQDVAFRVRPGHERDSF